MKSNFDSLKNWSEKRNPHPHLGHELRFQRKLKRQNKPVKRMIAWASIAASFLLILGVNFSAETTTSSSPGFAAFYTEQIQHQLKRIETDYPQEFQQPISDSKQQLIALHDAYEQLAIELENNHNHPLLIKAMIENLQQQLTLLSALEQQLLELKTQDYENKIL